MSARHKLYAGEKAEKPTAHARLIERDESAIWRVYWQHHRACAICHGDHHRCVVGDALLTAACAVGAILRRPSDWNVIVECWRPECPIGGEALVPKDALAEASGGAS